MDMGVALEVVGGVLLALLLVPLIVLYARRRWLARQGGMVDCGMRVTGPVETPWKLGAARYNGEHLEFFPAFSFAFTPRVRLRRTATTVLGTREPSPEEGVVLYSGQRIVRLESAPDFGDTQGWEIAMEAGSATGLLSWLEAAPPSVGRFRA